MASHELIEHVMPGTAGGDTSWFYRQNPFEQQEIRRQVGWKQTHWPELGNGEFAKLPWHHYPHILPDEHTEKNFFAPIAQSALKYMENEDIALHTENLNLKSSQVACFNFLFPLRQDLGAALRVLKPFFPQMERVTGIDFEFTGPNEATQWLGEPGSGKRGQNRTSIDAAVIYEGSNQQKCAALIEWKYTEHSYGGCSAYAGAKGEKRATCQQMNVAVDPLGKTCILTSGKRHCQRHYWDLLETAGVSLEALHGLAGCPFQGPFYQLLRQYLLAAYLRTEMGFDFVEVVSVDFAGNSELRKVPPHVQPLLAAQGGDVLDAWNAVLRGVPPMRHIHAEELAQSIQSAEIDLAWRKYLLERYGV